MSLSWSWLAKTATDKLNAASETIHAASEKINQFLDEVAGDDNPDNVTTDSASTAQSISPPADKPDTKSEEAEDESEPNDPDDDFDYSVSVFTEEFARGIAEHPETFTEFPEELKQRIGWKRLSRKQVAHARAVLERSPDLSNLRYVLCPKHISDIDFWIVYFTLLRNSQTSTPQPAAAHNRVDSLTLLTAQQQLALKLSELDFSLDHARIVPDSTGAADADAAQGDLLEPTVSRGISGSPGFDHLSSGVSSDVDFESDMVLIGESQTRFPAALTKDLLEEPPAKEEERYVNVNFEHAGNAAEHTDSTLRETNPSSVRRSNDPKVRSPAHVPSGAMKLLPILPSPSAKAVNATQVDDEDQLP